MAMLPNVVTSLIQVSVSVKRISKFLSLEELNTHQIDKTPNKGSVMFQLISKPYLKSLILGISQKNQINSDRFLFLETCPPTS